MSVARARKSYLRDTSRSRISGEGSLVRTRPTYWGVKGKVPKSKEESEGTLRLGREEFQQKSNTIIKVKEPTRKRVHMTDG